MQFRTSLRYRVTLAFALLGLVVSLGLAGSLYVLTIQMEERLIAETLSTELKEYMARYQQDPKTPPPSSTTIRTFVNLPGSHDIPPVLQGLGAGLHQVKLEGKEYYAEVRLVNDRHFIVLYHDRQLRHRENQYLLFLGIGIVAMILISALSGYWLAGRVIAPVGELARRVAGLLPADHPAALNEDFPDDEVGKLAREFDTYQQRLADFMERERAFTSDVSHELRTPLAVIKGATEVLLDDPGLDETRRLRAERIARSTREMSELVSALLLLAREERDEVSPVACAVDAVLQQVVDGVGHLLQHKAVDIKLEIQTKKHLPVECTLLRVVLANLIRNAINYTEQGQVYICLDAQGVTVKDTGIGIPQESLQRVFERYYIGATGSEGIGLSLVKRICRRYGWRIEIDSSEGHGTLIRLLFKPLRQDT